MHIYVLMYECVCGCVLMSVDACLYAFLHFKANRKNKNKNKTGCLLLISILC